MYIRHCLHGMMTPELEAAIPPVATKATLATGGSVPIVPAGGSTPILLQGSGGLLEGCWHNLAGQVQVDTQVLNALVCQEPVVVPPRKELSHQLARLEALHQLDHLHDGMDS